MLETFRRQLTAWFVALFLVLYCLSGLAAAVVFYSVLTAQLDLDLLSLRSEIAPRVDQTVGIPTLKSWNDNLLAHHQRLAATVQLFDGNGHFYEEYGPVGIQRLSTGNLSEPSREITVRSSYKPINQENPKAGYVQVQLSTKYRDDAVRQLAITLTILAPFFALVIWITGHFFSTRASRPVELTMELLRRFVADAGHEFNTPITVIEASIQTLEEVFNERGLSTEVLEVITRASARMKDLAAKLMLLAKMENPGSVANMVPVDLSELLSPLIEEFSALAAQKRITIKWQKEPAVTAIGNAESLCTLVSNLIDNALSYTEAGGEITVSLNNKPHFVTLTVEDTGIGIPQESIGHIFERFYRVDKSRSRAVGGSGLGLSIVKAIVDNHSGTIKAESQVGIGTKFTVFLPTQS